MKLKGIVKQWRFPEASERELARNIQRAVAKLVELMRRKTHAMKFDATDAEITDAEPRGAGLRKRTCRCADWFTSGAGGNCLQVQHKAVD